MMMVAVAAVMLVLDLRQILSGSSLTFHGLHQLSASQLIPRRSDQSCLAVMLPQKCHSSIQLSLGDGIGTGQNDGGGRLDLIVIELAKVLHIDLDLTRISNCYRAAQHHIIGGYLLYSRDHIGQLPHAGGLDDDAIRMIAVDNLHQSLAEIAHQRAADAAGVHLRNVDARILQETAVNTDLTELVFDEHQLLAAVGFLNHLFDQSGLTGPKEAGIYVNNSHSNTPSV